MHDWQSCVQTDQLASTSGYWPSGCNATFADWPVPYPNSTDIKCSDDPTGPSDMFFEPTEAFYYDDSFKCDCWRQLDVYMSVGCCRTDDDPWAVAFNFLYGINAILLWARTLHFFEQNSKLGPLIKIIGAMKNDFSNYLKLTVLIMLGFSLAMRAFIGDHSEQFTEVSGTLLYMFKSTFGKIDFSVLDACGEEADDLCSDGVFHRWSCLVNNPLNQ